MQQQNLKRICKTLLILSFILLIGLGLSTSSLAQEPSELNHDTLQSNNQARPLADLNYLATLTASDGNGGGEVNGDNFGYTVAISGDTAVVGAVTGETLIGTIYVFEKPTDGGWVNATEIAKLTPSDGLFLEWFSSSIIIDGDTILIGAYGNNSAQGAVYIYEKPNDGWTDMTETVKLTADDGQSGDYFGWSMALSDNTLFVGARDSGDNDSGAVYIFDRTDANQIAKLTASSDDKAIDFGFSIATNDDTLVISDSGRNVAYLFTRAPGSSWADVKEVNKLRPSDGEEDSPFDDALAINDEAIIMGVPSKGAAYLFQRPEDGWAYAEEVEAAKLTPNDSQEGDRFGYALAIRGNTIFIGAPDSGDNGAVYIFEGSDQIGKLPIEISSSGEDQFGNSVSISGDTLLIGASGVDNFKGAAYIFE